MANDPGSTPLRFNNPVKLRRQMNQRGWTEVQVHEAMHTTPIVAVGKFGPALRYVHPVSGKSVVVDEKTGEIFHVGGEGFRYG